MRTLLLLTVVLGLIACSKQKPASDQSDVTVTADAAPMPVESKCVTPDGKEVAIGESFPSADGCNTCTCSEAGGAVCTEKACVQE